MKRIILSAVAALLISTPAAFSQGRVSIDKDGLLKKVERSNQDIANPKKASKASTWLNRGQLFYDVETEVGKGIYEGLDRTMAELMYGKARTQSISINGTDYTKLVFPNMALYVDAAGLVNMWEITTVIKEGALDEAVASYKKSYEFDPSPKNAEKVHEGLRKIFDHLYKTGSNYFKLAEYGKAGDLFLSAYNLSQDQAFGVIDQTIVASLAHDAGAAYLFSGRYENAVKYFTLAEEKGYENNGEIYYLIYHSYKGISATDPAILNQAKSVLEKGMAKFPDNANIIECMTDVYVLLGEDPQGIIPVVQAAIQKDPENPALWNGLGRIYERLGDIDKSIEAFEHVAKLMPESFSAYYSVGILYIRKADALMTEVNAQSFSGQAEYDAARDKVFAVYLQAIAPLEKAHLLNPTEVVTVELLKNVTFRLRDMDGMMDKYNKYNELLKTMVK